MLRRILGPLVFLLGLGLAAWIFYNLFIERTKYAHSGPKPAIGLSLAFLVVGWKWMRGEQAG